MHAIAKIGLAVASSFSLALMAPTQPANADDTYTATTSENDGWAVFQGYGEIFKACDDTWDSEMTVARLFNEDGQETRTIYNDQGSGTCVTENFSIPDGTILYIQACNFFWDEDPFNCGDKVRVVA